MICGAQDWAHGDRDEIIIYGTCDLPAGHDGRWHRQLTASGRLWAMWGGSADARAPQPTDAKRVYWEERALALAEKLLDIAEIAMPDTYLETDSRVKLARKTIEEIAADDEY